MLLGGGGSSDGDAVEPVESLAFIEEASVETTTTTTPPETNVPDTRPPLLAGIPTDLLDADQASLLRLYVATFGRAPDATGFAHWTDRLRGGTSLVDVAQQFTDTPEFQEQFGSAPQGDEVVTRLHRNLLDRDATDQELASWLGQWNQGLSLPQLLVAFTESEASIDATGTRK